MKKISNIDYFVNGLCTHCHDVKNELIEFNQFHFATETAWQKEDNTLAGAIDDLIKKYPEARTHDIAASYAWDSHLNQVKYPAIHRESLDITIFNFFENQLNGLCQILSGCVESKVELKHLNGKGIERARLYLTKVVDFDLSNLNPEWSYIKSVNELRNQIVHNGGLLPPRSRSQAK